MIIRLFSQIIWIVNLIFIGVTYLWLYAQTKFSLIYEASSCCVMVNKLVLPLIMTD